MSAEQSPLEVIQGIQKIVAMSQESEDMKFERARRLVQFVPEVRGIIDQRLWVAGRPVYGKHLDAAPDEMVRFERLSFEGNVTAIRILSGQIIGTTICLDFENPLLLADDGSADRWPDMTLRVPVDKIDEHWLLAS